MRVALPVRGGLSEAILRDPRRVISGFYPMQKVGTECGRAGHACCWNAAGRFWPKRVRRSKELQIPRAGLGPKPSRPMRVKSSTGSFNARWRREPGGGNTDRPETDPLRVFAETKAKREKLNDESPGKGLPVNDSRDASRVGKAQPEWVRGRFCILPPEISPEAKRDWKLC